MEVNLVNRFVTAVPGCKLLNLYGSTEVAGDVTCFEISDLAASQSRVPIGKPIDNTKIYILDKNLNMVPIGVTGEIFVSGHGVAKGYLNRQELTSEKFIQNPFFKDRNDILFKSGDLGRYLTDGKIEYMGRRDQQVKIRGIRVELGEVEQAIKGYPEVKEVSVSEWMDNYGYKSLIAHLVLENNDATTDELKNKLKKSLPEYAVPSVFIKLDSMPLLPNGKVNRRLLINLNDKIILNKEYVPVEGDMEKELLSIWQKLLKKQEIGAADNFFSSGGDSIKGAVLCRLINKRLGSEVVLKDIFYNPTIRELANYLISRYIHLHLELDQTKF